MCNRIMSQLREVERLRERHGEREPVVAIDSP